MKIDLKNIDAIVFDFDGVLTNNLVYLTENGEESVACSRSDGLAFKVLRVLNIPCYILSSEKNKVVSARAKKLELTALQGVKDKRESLQELARVNNYNYEKIIYVGNDINDYRVMQSCAITVCPSDSHDKIKKISSIILKTSGGNGIVRELLEDVFDLDLIEILYPE